MDLSPEGGSASITIADNGVGGNVSLLAGLLRQLVDPDPAEPIAVRIGHDRSTGPIAKDAGIFPELAGIAAFHDPEGRQERQERASPTLGQAEDWVRCRYLGAAFGLQDRLFLIDYESLTLNEMSQTILIPSFKSRITRLNGLKTGVSSGDRRNPACTRVVWEYLGPEINRISAYRQVRLYRPDDARIDEDVRQRLNVAPLKDGLFEIE